MIEATPTRNPFPAEAVATYSSDRALLTCASLRYMNAVREPLDAFVKAYLDDLDRAGASIGITGPYGSGKTHVLMWLRDTALRFATIRMRVVYLKADTPQVTDVYKQMMTQLPRDQLIELVQLALLRLARERALSARITESLVDRLEKVGALTQLDAEQNIDLEQLRQELIERLISGSMATREMARALLDLPDPVLGPEVQAWLSANPAANLASLGVVRPVNLTPSDTPADADLVAITMFDLLAALHRQAGVPLLVLLDQFEMLLGPGADIARIGSTFKKLIEQLNAQAALVVVAGTPAGWAAMPRDVFARFRTRQPIRVGRLDATETGALVSAYAGYNTPFLAFASELRDLSNGSPREILRIAHQATERIAVTGGVLQRTDLVDAAGRAGSLADQAHAALAIADLVLPGFGTVSRDVSIAGVTIDRLLDLASGRGQLALVLLKAGDAVQEVGQIRTLTAIDAALERSRPNTRRLAVTIGYASAEAASLTPRGAQMRYDEETWQTQLTSFVATADRDADLVALAPAVIKTRAVDIDAVLARLDRLETSRLEERETVAERFVESARQASASLASDRRLQNRVEMEDVLDRMENALRDRDVELERSLLRLVMVANERFLNDDVLADLARFYRQCLPLSDGWDEPRRRSIREDLLLEMNSQLSRPRNVISSAYSHPNRMIAIITILGLISGISGFLLANTVLNDSEQSRGPLWENLLLTILTAALTLIYAFGVGYFVERSRTRKRRDRIRAQIDNFKQSAEEPNIGSQYPQS